MNWFVDQLFQIPDAARLGWVFAVLLFVILLEFLMPLCNFAYHKFKHVSTNLVFLVTSLISVSVVVVIAIEVMSVHELEFGVLYLLDLPLWAEMIISILLLDLFGQYLIHVLLHRYKWLWMIHLVHHSDTNVDASTATRHHPGDLFIRTIVTFTTVVVFGIPIVFYILYGLISPFFGYLSHGNIQLPAKLDRYMCWVFVSPNMHKVHHHFERPWTNSNYGNIFSFWDRLFGTFVYVDPRSVHYGLDTVDGSKHLNLRYQFALPFNKNIKTDY